MVAHNVGVSGQSALLSDHYASLFLCYQLVLRLLLIIGLWLIMAERLIKKLLCEILSMKRPIWIKSRSGIDDLSRCFVHLQSFKIASNNMQNAHRRVMPRLPIARTFFARIAIQGIAENKNDLNTCCKTALRRSRLPIPNTSHFLLSSNSIKKYGTNR